MPWVPELFTAPALEQVLERRERERVAAVPFFDGLLAGEPDALVASFAGEPELHHPVRGRIKGTRQFLAYVAAMNAWVAAHDVVVEDLGHTVLEARGFEEGVLHVGAEGRRVELPFAIVADHPSGRIEELRIYFSDWPLSGRHAVRPPLLQHDPDLHVPDVVGAYRQALAAGDLDAALAAFEPDGSISEPAGEARVHRGAGELRAFHERLFAGGGAITSEHCALADDGRTCALEYNVLGRGGAELPPQAGVAVYVRGASGRLAAARVYDDVA